MARVATVQCTAEELAFQYQAHEQELKHQIRVAALDAAYATLRPVARATPVDLGEMKNAWTVREGPGEVAAELRNDAPHAGIVELGARPHWPPFEPIFEWALRHAGDLALGGVVKIGSQAFRKSKSGNLFYKGQSSLDDDDVEEVRRFAYALCAKIAREGQKPTHLMLKHLPFAQRAWQRALDEYLGPLAAKKFTGGAPPAGGAISGL